MTMTLPSAVNLHTTDPDTDARDRGESGTGASGSKVNGNLPITSNASQRNNQTASNPTGVVSIQYWEFLATGGYDVSTDTRLFVWSWQFNAPNRVQVATAANDGVVMRIGSGAGTPPTTNWKHYQIAGNDKVGGSAREQPKMIVIDLNETVSAESTAGTFDNTDVQTYGFGTVRFNISGNNSNLCFWQRAFVFTTTKASADIPTFTGASDWDDLVDLVDGTDYTDKIGNEWALREGNVYSIAAPTQIGDNSTETDFNDNGAVVFFPDSNTASDPRVRVTSQAFRHYLNLRNNAADTAVFSGTYDCGNSYPDWDHDQDDSAVVTYNSPSWKRTGVFLVGSSVTGPGTWDDCDVVDFQDNGVDLDGSTFKNPHGNHLVSLAA